MTYRRFFYRWLSRLAFLLLSLTIPPAVAASGKQTNTFGVDEDGIYFDSPNSGIQLQLGGRLHYDTVDADNSLTANESKYRRVRLDLSGKLGADWRFKIDREFAPDREGWRSVRIEYRGLKNTNIKIGQVTQPFSMEELTSSNDLIFLTSSLPGTLSPEFGLGVLVEYRGDDWVASGGIFGNELDDDSERDNGTSLVARYSREFEAGSQGLLHAAVAVEHRELDRDAGARVSSRAEISFTERSLIRSRRLRDAQRFTTFNVELAWLDGPFLLQGQWLGREVRGANRNRQHNGAYLMAAWLLNGGERRYSSGGYVDSVEPASPYGSFELALRASHLNLAEDGGKATNYGAALSWYVTENMRLSANYLYVRLHPSRDGIDVNGNVLQARAQVMF